MNTTPNKVVFIKSLSTARDSFVSRKEYVIGRDIDERTADEAVRGGIAQAVPQPEPVKVEPVAEDVKKPEPKAKPKKADPKKVDAK